MLTCQLFLALLSMAVVISGCSERSPTSVDDTVDDTVDETVDHGALVEAIARSRSISAEIEMEVVAVVDGERAATIEVTGSIVDGGTSFRLAVEGPQTGGRGTPPVEVMLAAGRLLQRGPTIETLVPEAAGRWVDVGVDTAALPELGLAGRDGFGVFDLLDDPMEVRRPGPDLYEGTLGRVGVDGIRVVSAKSAGFRVQVSSAGLIERFGVELDDGQGVQLSIDVAFSAIGRVEPIELPETSDILTL